MATRVGSPFLKKRLRLASLNPRQSVPWVQKSSVRCLKVDQKQGIWDPCFCMLSIHKANAFQKLYWMLSGPGAELGILLFRASISPMEKGLEGELAAGGGREVAILKGDFLDKGVLGSLAGSRVRYRGMQAVVEIMGNHDHVFESGGGRVIWGAM